MVILTGSSGYLGRKVRRTLEERNFNLIPLDVNDPDEPLSMWQFSALDSLP
jgi:hypothetical protein